VEWISPAAFDVLWESVVLDGPRPAVLAAPSPGATAGHRRELVDDAWAELRRTQYAGWRGAVDEVATQLTMVSRPRVAVDVRLYEWMEPAEQRQDWWLTRIGFRVTHRDWRAAAAAYGPDGFCSWSFPVGSFVNEVIRLFPEHRAPAYFSGLTLPPDHIARRPRSAEPVLRLLEGPYRRRAHMCVVTRDQVSGSERVSDGLVLNDTHSGRYLAFTARNQITIVPGDNETFERKLKELLADPVHRY
jgi:hypothetical protein